MKVELVPVLVVPFQLINEVVHDRGKKKYVYADGNGRVFMATNVTQLDGSIAVQFFTEHSK